MLVGGSSWIAIATGARTHHHAVPSLLLFFVQFAGSGGGGNTASAFLQDLVSAFTGGDSYVEVSFSGSFTTLFDDTNGATANAFKFILDSSSITTAYTNQIGRGSANIKLIAQELATTIPAALQAPSV